MYQRVLTYQQPSANIAHSIKVIPKNSAFFDEDFIEGIVEFNCTAQVIINDINLSLNSSENWSAYSKELNLNTNEKKSEVIFSINMDVKRQLNIPTNLIALKPGKFNFPFKFKLPRLVEPSFEFPGVEGKAFIRYILTANIISPYIRGMNQVYILMKRKQKIEINKTISFSKENSIHKWGLFDGGNTKLEITSVNGTDNFKYGENIKFNININNTKGKLNTTECKVVINRLVLFKSKYGETLKSYNDEIFAEKTKVETTPGEEKQFSYILNLKKIQNKKIHQSSNELIKSISNKPKPETKIKKRSKCAKIIQKKNVISKKKLQINNEDSSTNCISGLNNKGNNPDKNNLNNNKNPNEYELPFLLNNNKETESESFFINFKLGEKDSYMENISKTNEKNNLINYKNKFFKKENPKNSIINLKYDYCKVNNDCGNNEDDSLEMYDFNDESNVEFVLKNMSALSNNKTWKNDNSNYYQDCNESIGGLSKNENIINNVKILEVQNSISNPFSKI